jgi:glycerol-3-phosphate acyltransferase PlsY
MGARAGNIDVCPSLFFLFNFVLSGMDFRMMFSQNKLTNNLLYIFKMVYLEFSYVLNIITVKIFRKISPNTHRLLTLLAWYRHSPNTHRLLTLLAWYRHSPNTHRLLTFLAWYRHSPNTHRLLTLLAWYRHSPNTHRLLTSLWHNKAAMDNGRDLFI